MVTVVVVVEDFKLVVVEDVADAEVVEVVVGDMEVTMDIKTTTTTATSRIIPLDTLATEVTEEATTTSNNPSQLVATMVVVMAAVMVPIKDKEVDVEGIIMEVEIVTNHTEWVR